MDDTNWQCEELNETTFNCIWGSINDEDTGYDIGTSGERYRQDYFIIRKIIHNEITGICRISINNPSYITGYNENLVISKNEKLLLMEALHCDRDLGTSWERIFDNYNYFNNYKLENHFPILPMPDYSKL